MQVEEERYWEKKRAYPDKSSNKIVVLLVVGGYSISTTLPWARLSFEPTETHR